VNSDLRFLPGLCADTSEKEDYEYEKLERVMDGGNACEDVFLHRDFVVDSELGSEAAEEQRKTALRRLESLMEQHSLSRSMRKEVLASSKLLIDDLARVQKVLSSRHVV
jgi:hypothetical protein